MADTFVADTSALSKTSDKLSKASSNFNSNSSLSKKELFKESQVEAKTNNSSSKSSGSSLGKKENFKEKQIEAKTNNSSSSSSNSKSTSNSNNTSSKSTNDSSSDSSSSTSSSLSKKENFKESQVEAKTNNSSNSSSSSSKSTNKTNTNTSSSSVNKATEKIDTINKNVTKKYDSINKSLNNYIEKVNDIEVKLSNDAKSKLNDNNISISKMSNNNVTKKTSFKEQQLEDRMNFNNKKVNLPEKENGATNNVSKSVDFDIFGSLKNISKKTNDLSLSDLELLEKSRERAIAEDIMARKRSFKEQQLEDRTHFNTKEVDLPIKNNKIGFEDLSLSDLESLEKYRDKAVEEDIMARKRSFKEQQLEDRTHFNTKEVDLPIKNNKIGFEDLSLSDLKLLEKYRKKSVEEAIIEDIMARKSNFKEQQLEDRTHFNTKKVTLPEKKKKENAPAIVEIETYGAIDEFFLRVGSEYGNNQNGLASSFNSSLNRQVRFKLKDTSYEFNTELLKQVYIFTKQLENEKAGKQLLTTEQIESMADDFINVKLPNLYSGDSCDYETLRIFEDYMDFAYYHDFVMASNKMGSLFERVNVDSLYEGSNAKRLLDKLTDIGMPEYEARQYMEAINSTGVCTYATRVNEILATFKDDPYGFKECFGFDMYVHTPDGLQLNSDELMLDMYTWVNSNYYSSLNDNKTTLLKVDTDGSLRLNDFDTQNQVYLYKDGVECFGKYLETKGLKLTEKGKFVAMDNSIDIFGQNFIKTVKKEMDKGNLVVLGVYSPDATDKAKERYFPLSNSNSGKNSYQMVDLNTEEVICDTSTWENSGHAMFVTGVKDDEGVIVSTWGDRALIKEEDFKKNVYEYDVISIERIED